MSTQMETERNTERPVATGFAIFGAVMMIVIGFFQAFEGLVAVVRENYYVVTPRYLYEFDVTVWGWIHLVVGALAIVAGVFVFGGHLWARIIGIIMATVSAITNFLFVGYYPLWSLTIVACCVVTIWALCVYNKDIALRGSDY